MNKVLIIAAHPDDDILGCGGFIAKYRNKMNFKVIFVAEGSSCRFDDMILEKTSIEIEINKRRKCAINALSLLGVSDVKFNNLVCGRLDNYSIIEINKIIEEEIYGYSPDLIFTHSENDINNDHRLVYRSVMMATRPGSYKSLKSVLSFEVQSSSEWNFETPFSPNTFEVLGENDLNAKWDALRCYSEEIRDYPHPRSYEGLKALAMYRGIQVGEPLSEAYRVIWSKKL